MKLLATAVSDTCHIGRAPNQFRERGLYRTETSFRQAVEVQLDRQPQGTRCAIAIVIPMDTRSSSV